MNEVIIGPLLNHIFPTPPLPVRVQIQHRGTSLVQRSEGLPAIEDSQQQRQLKISWLFLSLLPLEFTVTEPQPQRPSRMLINGAEREREESHNSATAWQQRAFNWAYSISEYIETHPYVTMTWVMVLSFLFSLSRH